MSDTTPPIVEIIGSGRWRRAVFTSFTLSLTYFECYILPRLRAQGCSAIDIYVDVMGYRDSLVEQRSRHAGRDYTVHPVQVKSGIFHPKLIYLWPEEGDNDVLLVGSGNLTYAGHGGSLEVFEVLRPVLHARAYAQAAAFFGDLADTSPDRIDIGGASGPLEALQRRTLSLAEKYPNVHDVQFVHCLRESGLQQLAREFAGQKVDELLVMSPYHHPEATPIKALVELFTPETLLVGIDGTAGSSPFPFERSAKWECSVRAVVAGPAKNRFVHAKWYEWRSGGRATTFTGSFNATAESLTSCNNVECGVLRRNTTPSTDWVDVQPLPFQKQSFPRMGRVGEWLVTASLSGRCLSGRIIGYTAKTPRDWSFSLQSGDLAPTLSQQLRTEEDGEFKIQLAQRIDTDAESGIQIRMESGAHTARGWVALPQILNIGAQRRTLLSTLSDVGRGSETAASFAGFLAIVMDEIRSFTAATITSPHDQETQGKQRKSAAAHQLDQNPGPTAAPRDIITDGPAFGGSPRDRLMAALSSGQSGWAVWGQLAHVLLGPSNSDSEKDPAAGPVPGPRITHPPAHPITHQDPEDDADPEALEAEQDALTAALDSFNSLIAHCRLGLQKQVERARAAGEAFDQILMNLAHLERTWLHVMLRAYVGPLNNVQVGVNLLGEWLHSAVEIAFVGPSQELMLFEYAGCAAVLAHQNAAQPGALMETLAQSRPPSKAMRSVQYLEAAFGGAPDVEMTLDLAAGWLNSQVGHALVRGEVEQALTALRIALTQPTPRALVARYLKEKPSYPDPAAWRPFNERMLSLLRTAARGRPPQYYGSIDVRAVSGCSVCNRDLRITAPGRDQRRPDPTMLAQLKLFCVAECPRCYAPLINRIALSE